MRYQDIRVGGSYRVGDRRWLGRAVITGPAVKDRFNKRYSFPIEFPDAMPGHSRPEMVQAADIRGPWTMEDQQQWERDAKEAAELRAIEQGLIAADFEPAWVRSKPGVRSEPGPLLWISFEGEVAKRVVDALLASVELKSQVLELETHGPHDED